MPTTTQAFSKLLAPGLRKVFFQNYKMFPEEYSRIANVETSKRAYEEELTTAGLGRFESKGEGKSIVYDDPMQGNVKRYTHVSFGLGFRVSREMYDDDLYGVMKKMSKELAMAARQTQELEFASMLDDAFDGNIHTGADGKALCATDHPLLIGGTYANEPSTARDLSIGALRASQERMEKIVNERGLPEMRGKGKVIVISPEWQWIAKEIIGSELKPYTADNEINAFNDMGMSYMVSHYKASTDSWFLLADKAMHGIKFFWRQKPVFENSDDFDTKDAKFTGYMRFSYGFTDWRGIDGSSGAA